MSRNKGNKNSGSKKNAFKSMPKKMKNGGAKGSKPMREKKGGNRKADLLEQVSRFFMNYEGDPVSYKDVARALEISDMSCRQQLIDILLEMVSSGYLVEASHGIYKLNPRNGAVIGKIVAKRGGGAILEPEDGGEEIIINDRNLNKSAVGDKVKVRLFAHRPGKEQEGEVVEVLEHSRETFVGKLQVKEGYAFLLVDNRILGNDIFVPLDKINGGKDNDKAIVRILDWAEKGRNPVGEVIEVLGASGDNNAEMHAILCEYDLPYSYPEEIEKFADQIPEEISAEEIAKRKDMRDVPTFTIDPKDAKDFDDALSFRKLDDGLFEVGVHIADVTHYVKLGEIIEEEAVKRATSIYLVDRTIPMLPERLCNKVCSLRPNEEKLCYSVVFKMDKDARVKDYEIVHTVINSDRRFTYEDAQQVIETKEGDMKEEILALDDLAKKLREERFKKGAIAFEREEVRFEIDETGKPIDVYFKVSKDANKLIEEFMLLANRTVAEHIGKAKSGDKAKTFVYRIHDNPDPEKLSNLTQFISRFGYKLNITGKNNEVSSAINNLLDKVQGTKEQNLIETIAIRSMAKAIYSIDNVGHYGLAFDYYTHFTSPIRRYPDMMVHRLLDRYAAGQKSADTKTFEELCKHCSEREQVAASAERASIKYKQVEFMKDHLGQVYDGVISGVTEWGIYVELSQNKCEGMIPMRDLDDDYYMFDEKNYCIIGKRTGRKFQLGDEVVVRIARADLDKKQLDYELIEKK